MQDSKEILERLRKYPGLYTGKNTLQSTLLIRRSKGTADALRASIDAFLAGYWFATNRYSISTHDDDLLLPNEFHSWVAYRLHFSSSHRGWCNLIYERTSSEKDAIDKFFELYEEFKDRKSHVIARFVGFNNIKYTCNISNSNNIRFYSNPITLVTYTDDPRFFVYLNIEDNSPRRDFYNSLESFEFNTEIKRHMLTVVDPKWKSKNF